MLVSYVYQADGRLESVTREYGNGSDYVQYQYNEYGHTTQIRTNGQALLFTYDGLDRLSKKSADHGNGQVDTEYTYWTDGDYTSNRITSIKYKTGSQTLTNIQYEYDNLGNITRINDGTETRICTAMMY